MNPRVTTPGSGGLVAYFGLTYAFSWSIGVPLALAAQGVMAPILPPWCHYLIAYGPLFSAVIVTAATKGPPGLQRLWARVTRWRVAPLWWLVDVSPLGIGLVLVLALNLLTDRSIGLAQLGDVRFLPPWASVRCCSGL